MRLGLLGLGRIGAFHAEILTSLPAVDELVLSDPVPALAEQVAGRAAVGGADHLARHGPPPTGARTTFLSGSSGTTLWC